MSKKLSATTVAEQINRSMRGEILVALSDEHHHYTAGAQVSDWTPPADVLPRVVCAACKMTDGTVVLGARHWDGRMIATADMLNRKRSHDPADQGFIDQWGRFMTREQAWKAAEASGQIFRRGKSSVGVGAIQRMAERSTAKTFTEDFS